MKIRNSFVRNSSSSSFIVKLDNNIPADKKEKIAFFFDILGKCDITDRLGEIIDDLISLKEVTSDELIEEYISQSKTFMLSVDFGAEEMFDEMCSRINKYHENAITIIGEDRFVEDVQKFLKSKSLIEQFVCQSCKQSFNRNEVVEILGSKICKECLRKAK